MTPRTIDNTNFWQLVGRYLRAGTKDSYGTAPNVPATAMLKIAERVWRKRCRG